jgi:hypothetical protein
MQPSLCYLIVLVVLRNPTAHVLLYVRTGDELGARLQLLKPYHRATAIGTNTCH